MPKFNVTTDFRPSDPEELEAADEKEAACAGAKQDMDDGFFPEGWPEDPEEPIRCAVNGVAYEVWPIIETVREEDLKPEALTKLKERGMDGSMMAVRLHAVKTKPEPEVAS